MQTASIRLIKGTIKGHPKRHPSIFSHPNCVLQYTARLAPFIISGIRSVCLRLHVSATAACGSGFTRLDPLVPAYALAPDTPAHIGGSLPPVTAWQPVSSALKFSSLWGTPHQRLASRIFTRFASSVFWAGHGHHNHNHPSAGNLTILPPRLVVSPNPRYPPAPPI
jgi:hypothetical protein